MLRILFLVETLDVGGAEMFSLQWLKYCDKNKFSPYVISLRDGKLHREFEQFAKDVVILSKKRPFDLVFLMRLLVKIKKVAPDVILCLNGIPVISYGVFAAKILKIPVISSIHGRTHFIHKNFRTQIWFLIMKLSSLLITVTQSIKNEMIVAGGIPPGKVCVIHNGIDTSPSTPRSREQLRKEFGFLEDEFIIGTIGNLRSIKGHQYLLQAFKKTMADGGNERLVLIGTGPEEMSLKGLVQDLGISDRVSFLGYQPNAAHCIPLFDLFVLSSLSEGLPLVLLESMMAKVPIVTTNVGGIPEVVKDGQEAFLVPPADCEALADAIQTMKMDPERRKIFAQNAVRRVYDQFDIREKWAIYDKIYLSFQRDLNG